MSKEWRWWLGEFGLATVVVVVSSLVTRDIPISVLFGLFVGTVFFILRQHSRVASQVDRQVAELGDKALNLPVAFIDRENIDPLIKQIVRSERDDVIRLAKGAADGEIVLRTRHISQIMIDFHKLARPGDRVVATNTGVGWGAPQFDIVRQINFELADKGVDFTRVFIELTGATPEDKKRLKQEMDKQKEHLKIRFVKESHLPPEAVINMALIYDRYLGCGSYSKAVGSGRRQIVDELKIYTRRDELEKAKEMAETAIRLSEEYK